VVEARVRRGQSVVFCAVATNHESEFGETVNGRSITVAGERERERGKERGKEREREREGRDRK
jgi:hypothetical protein